MINAQKHQIEITQFGNSRHLQQGRIALVVALLLEIMPQEASKNHPASTLDCDSSFLGMVGQGLNATQANIFQHRQGSLPELLVKVNLTTGQVVFKESLAWQARTELLQELIDVLVGSQAQLSEKWRGINILKTDAISYTKPLLTTDKQGKITFIGTLEDTVVQEKSKVILKKTLKSIKQRSSISCLPSSFSHSSRYFKSVVIDELDQLIRLLRYYQKDVRICTLVHQKLEHRNLINLAISLHHMATKAAQKNMPSKSFTARKPYHKGTSNLSRTLFHMSKQVAQIAYLTAKIKRTMNGTYESHQ